MSPLTTRLRKFLAKNARIVRRQRTAARSFTKLGQWTYLERAVTSFPLTRPAPTTRSSVRGEKPSPAGSTILPSARRPTYRPKSASGASGGGGVGFSPLAAEPLVRRRRGRHLSRVARRAASNGAGPESLQARVRRRREKCGLRKIPPSRKIQSAHFAGSTIFLI